MKLVGVFALIYLLANMVSRPLSAGEIAFCIMLAVVDLILLTTDKGGDSDAEVQNNRD